MSAILSERAGEERTLTRSRTLRIAVPVVAMALLLVLALSVVTAGAGTPIKTGKYSGKTSQEAVSSGFRKVQFTVKKGKVTLTTEPTVARGECLSTPVFTLDGTSSKKL